ncbi:MAG: GNAT family N-acetyltransferase, partial [Brevundimonas sp.]
MSLGLTVHGSIQEIGADVWDACAAPTGDPFVTYAFLHACEASGSAAPRQGWGPRHLLARDGDAILGVVPLYMKGHSQGEYVFDHSWADAYERAGGAYYPKLLGAVPFTPATGPRLLTHPDAAAAAAEDALIHGAVALTDQLDLSSLHILFPEERQWRRMGDAGMLLR